jgi:tRNA-splicing ligase RtcB
MKIKINESNSLFNLYILRLKAIINRKKTSMNLQRLQKAFQRNGITVDYDQGVYHLHNTVAQAKVLLPADLPLEEKAVQQLLDFAAVRYPEHDGHVCSACATPDFHPGNLAPVGSIVATTPDMVIPQSLGTDINCGMQLLSTPILEADATSYLPKLEKHLIRLFFEGGRDVPASGAAFRALFDDGPSGFLNTVPHQGIWAEADLARIEQDISRCTGLTEFMSLSRYAPEALIGNRDVLRDPGLGTIGSGNHFVEFQIVDRIYDRQTAFQYGLREGCLVVMTHSGSRDVGSFIGGRWIDKAKDMWPKGLAHPKSKLYALTGQMADEYLHAMGVAALYAWLNRTVLAEMVRKVLREILGCNGCTLVVDVPHNVVLQEHGMNIHRKGATPAREGDLALIPGSMGDFSYLVRGLGNPEWLWSCSHGAGRSVRRQAMRANKTSDGEQTAWRCLSLNEERKIEEAPAAYKPVGPVLTSQEEKAMIRAAVRFRPWLTLKA